MIVIQDKGMPIKAWVDGVELEEEAKKQLINASQMPFIHKHIAVMPDVHAGYGATVGSVIPTRGAIIPAAVGVDIGCGMMAAKTNLTASDLPDNLFNIRSAIEEAIPHGRSNDGGVNDKGAWHSIPRDIPCIFASENLYSELWTIVERHPSLEKSAKRAANHLGTLGTGNHFIELCLDEQQKVWIMLHSGSRGIGNRIGNYFIELAKEDMRKWFINLPDIDLAYFPEGTQYFNEYIAAVWWAQRYAKANRRIMMGLAVNAIQSKIPLHIELEDVAINCHHNYVEKENHFGSNIWVTRKGAVRAREGELGIIPGSMGAKSFIVRGKGNKESFDSCSHGAGRKMSRTKAKAMFTIEDQIKATEGVECRKDADVIDEIPHAYKDIDAVMTAQNDLVEIVHTLRQVVCVKG